MLCQPTDRSRIGRLYRASRLACSAFATALLVAAALCCPRPAAATTADDICGPAVNPCRITNNEPVTPGSILDFGTRSVIIANHGTIDLQSGTMTLRAGEFIIEAGGNLEARGTTSTPGGRITVLADVITIGGNIDATGAPGGAVTLNSTGAITLNAPLEVRSRAMDSGGGSVTLDGTDITITTAGRISALGGGEDFGGGVEIFADAALSVASMIDVSGGDGGTIDLSAAGDLTVSATAVLTVHASAGGGTGGDIDISAGEILTMNGQLNAQGRNGSADSGAGDGGNVALEGSGITIGSSDARINAAAGTPDGVGGDVDLTADSDGIEFQGRIDTNGPGTDGSGGLVSLDGIGAVLVGGEVEASGGRGGGGDIDLTSDADIDIAADAVVAAIATSSGSGGDISVTSAEVANILGALASDGGPTQGGTGGSITVIGCEVNVEASGNLSSLRTNGINTIVGRDMAIIGGTLRADSGSGRNTLRFAGPEYQPAVLPGAVVNPPASLVEDASVIPCNPVSTFTPTIGLPSRTATPTRTVSGGMSSRTATPTRTPIPNACVGDCDDSGSVSIADLITGVNISLGNRPLEDCRAFDPDDSGTVSIAELIRAVSNSLNGCG